MEECSKADKWILEGGYFYGNEAIPGTEQQVCFAGNLFVMFGYHRRYVYLTDKYLI